jgi:hypothetical protein
VREPLLGVRHLKKHFAVGSSLFGRVRGWVKAVDVVTFTVHNGSPASNFYTMWHREVRIAKCPQRGKETRAREFAAQLPLT